MSKKQFIFKNILFLLVFLLMLSNSIIVIAVDQWPMFHHDSMRTGSTTSTSPNTNNVLWTFTTDDAIRWSSPAIVNDKVYFGSQDKKMYCVNAKTGEKIWDFETEGAIWSSPTIVDNKVYFGSYDNKIYCLNADTGEEIWDFEGDDVIQSSPTVNINSVFIGCKNGKLYAIPENDPNSDGIIDYDELLWVHEFSGEIYSSPAYYNEMLYVSTFAYEGELFCLNAHSGEIIWEYTIGYYSESSPSISNGRVYIGATPSITSKSYIYCIDADPDDNGDGVVNEDDLDEGEIDGAGSVDFIWKQKINGINVISTPAIADNKVFIGSWDSKVYCFNSESGASIWNRTVGSTIYSSPSISDGKVFIGTYVSDGKVYCLNEQNGEILWSYDTAGTYIESSPAIYDGKLYIGSSDGLLYCFRENTEPLQPSKPNGIDQGFTGEVYQYSINSTSDPENDKILYLFNWGDGTDSGWIETLEASHAWNEPSTYSLKVKAKDIYGVESDWSEPLIVTISATLPTLQITCASSVVEKESFTITVTSDQIPIENVKVTFNEQTKITDEIGEVTFIAPDVSSNTKYLIYASNDEYSDATKYITVLNQKEKTGWIFGTVTGLTGSIIIDASICAKLKNDGTTSFCAQSDEEGKYVLTLAEGEYIVEASKDGYEISTKTITIADKTATEVSFTFEKLEKQIVKTTPEEDVINRLISKEIEDGNIGGKLLFEKSSNYVQIYNEALEIEIDEYIKNEKIQFTISSDELKSDIVAIKLDYGTLADLNNLKIKFDGNDISSFGFEEIFNSEEPLDSAVWTSVLTYNSDGKEVAYILIKTPLSMHTITITSILTSLSQFTIILFYGLSGFSLVILFLSPVFIRFIKKRYF